jgi:2-haloacid dehalogenase
MAIVSIGVYMASEQHEYKCINPPGLSNILTIADKYEPFYEVTKRALRHALKEAGVSLSEANIEKMMSAYDSLSTFPDVTPALDALAKTPNIRSVIFSNGTHAMVSASLQKSPSLSPHASLFTEIVVVEEVKKFKPCPEVYYHLVEKVGKKREEIGEVWLVTSNPFDVVGSVNVGMKAVWVDRTGAGWVDSLGEGDLGKPTITVSNLEDVVDAIKEYGS